MTELLKTGKKAGVKINVKFHMLKSVWACTYLLSSPGEEVQERTVPVFHFLPSSTVLPSKPPSPVPIPALSLQQLCTSARFLCSTRPLSVSCPALMFLDSKRFLQFHFKSNTHFKLLQS